MAALLDQSRIAGIGNVFRAEVRHGMRMPFVRPTCATSSRSERRDPTEMRYRPGADGPARTPFALLVWALSVVVPPSRCGVCCVPLIRPRDRCAR